MHRLLLTGGETSMRLSCLCVMSVNETSTRLELFSAHLSGGCFVDATIVYSEKILPFLRRDN